MKFFSLLSNEAAPQTVEARMAAGRGGLRVLPGVG
jgi:hypothetical protein